MEALSMNLKHISHSSIVCADECLAKFQYTRLSNPEDRIPSLPAKPRDVGILTHSFIEAFFKDQSFLEKLSEQDHTEHHAEAVEIFSGWKSRFHIPEENWLFTEREGSVNVENIPVPLIGYDDFVYDDSGVHVLRDFKTGWGTEVYDSYAFQGDLACLRYEQEYPGIPLASEVEFVRRGIVSDRRPWTPVLKAATIARVQAIWEKIRYHQALNAGVLEEDASLAWPATPGSHCTFCDYKTECAVAKRAAGAHLVVTDEESALATLREIALMDEAIKTMKDAMRTYCDAHGEVVTGMGKYDYRAGYGAAGEAESVKDVKSVLDILGHDLPKGVLKIDLKLKGAGMIRNDPRVSAFIETKTASPRFVVGKKSDKEDAAESV